MQHGGGWVRVRKVDKQVGSGRLGRRRVVCTAEVFDGEQRKQLANETLLGGTRHERRFPVPPTPKSSSRQASVVRTMASCACDGGVWCVVGEGGREGGGDG
jgi:hypothetical protein